MTELHGRAARLSAIGLALLLLAPASRGTVTVPDTFDWYKGAEGFAAARELSEKGGRPLFIYFYVDWCPWCRALDKDYLEQKEVYEFIGDFLRVRVNPEAGKAERELASRYAVNGYPSFFVTLAGVGDARRVSPLRDEGNLTPDQFIREMKKVLAFLYVSKAINLWSTKEWEQSIRLFTTAQEYDPEVRRADYGLGVSLRELGEAGRDMEMFKRAETSLRKACDREPDTGACGELERVRTAMKNLGGGGTPPQTARGGKASGAAPSPPAAHAPKAPPRSEVQEMVSTLSRIIRETSPKLTMTLQGKWPTFRYLEDLCTLVNDERSVELHFFDGARLQDPQGKLRISLNVGTLTFSSASEIDPRHVRLLVMQAMEHQARRARP